jgi:hypothetical protein
VFGRKKFGLKGNKARFGRTRLDFIHQKKSNHTIFIKSALAFGADQ